VTALWTQAEPLVLASRSAARRALLTQAGIPTEAMASTVDERAIEAGLTNATPESLARTLAEAKARDVSARAPGRLVLGADQVLSLGTECLHKPADRAEAERHLATLVGRTHRLTSAAVVMKNGAIIAEAVQAGELQMRPLNGAQIAQYLDAAGESVLTSVGCYQIEGLGAHLFEHIACDFFTILGLPLLPLLAGLRDAGCLRP
jgi:septum formation protein